MTKHLQADTWHELVDKVMIFLESNHLKYQKSLYADSRKDYGSIVVWPRIMTWHGEKYSAVKLMNVTVPPALRRQGEYKRLLALLEGCGLYSLRIVESVQDENLIRFHQSAGEEPGPYSDPEIPSFAKVVGAPLQSRARDQRTGTGTSDSASASV